MIINEGYIGGVIDISGGFYIFNNRYLYFKIGIRNQQVMSVVYNYLKNKSKVNVRLYGRIYYITEEKSMFNFIKFLKKNCIRKDFIELIQTNPLIYEKYKTIINGGIKNESM